MARARGTQHRGFHGGAIPDQVTFASLGIPFSALSSTQQNALIAASDVALPFGGMKQSGFGREYGAEGVLAYTELKSVAALLGA